MPRRILVPLDRSDATRQVLLLVGDLAIAYASHEMERLESKGLDYLKFVIGG